VPTTGTPLVVVVSTGAEIEPRAGGAAFDVDANAASDATESAQAPPGRGSL
jgi:hypothetical protein